MTTYFKRWLKATSVRCIKTFAECVVGMVSIGQAFSDVNWVNTISAASVATIICFFTCIASLPEVEKEC